jgi:hypothetical protein
MCVRPKTRLRRHPGRPMETSSTLVRRVRGAGDADSWREFVALYEPLIVRYALGRRRGLSEPDARDVAQDVFVRLLKALPTFELDRSRGRFRTYLWQVTASALAGRAGAGPAPSGSTWSVTRPPTAGPSGTAPSTGGSSATPWSGSARRATPGPGTASSGTSWGASRPPRSRASWGSRPTPSTSTPRTSCPGSAPSAPSVWRT